MVDLGAAASAAQAAKIQRKDVSVLPAKEFIATHTKFPKLPFCF